MQVNDSGEWTLQEPTEEGEKSHRILQENLDNHLNMKLLFPAKTSRIFSDDLQSVPAEKHRKLIGFLRKKS
jgi:hypothetical protein